MRSRSKSRTTRAFFRFLGVLLLPFSGVFIFISAREAITRPRDPAFSFLLLGLFLFALALYLFFGARRLAKTIDWNV